MLRKIVTAVVVVPLAIVIVAFAVANRQAVTVSLDPLGSVPPAYSVTLPLFVIVFTLMILGVIVGGVAAWLRQGSWRRTARHLDAEVRQLHDEVTALRGQLAERQSNPATDLPRLPPGPVS